LGDAKGEWEGCEACFNALTENDLEDRYDLNQSKAVPEMQNLEES